MASFQDKIGWKCRETEKIKIIGPFRSHTTRNRKFQKNSKKFQKIKKIPLQLNFEPKQVGKGCEREKIKIKVPFLHDTEQKIPKNIAKKFKKLKNTFMASFQVKIGCKRPRRSENKNYRSVPFHSYPTRN